MDDANAALSRTLERVVIRFRRLLLAVGHRHGLGGAELDELVQDVRIRLWRALREGEKIAAVRPFYVERTALSAAVDLVRRRRARREDPLTGAAGRLERDGDPRLVVTPVERAEAAAEIRARLEAALEALAAPRDVVVKLHLAGYHRTEIAELTGWTEAKVRNLLYRGLEDLRAALRADAGAREMA